MCHFSTPRRILEARNLINLNCVVLYRLRCVSGPSYGPNIYPPPSLHVSFIFPAVDMYKSWARELQYEGQQVKGCPTNLCTNADRNTRGKAEDDHGRERMVGSGQPKAGRPPPFFFCCAHPLPGVPLTFRFAFVHRFVEHPLTCCPSYCNSRAQDLYIHRRENNGNIKETCRLGGGYG